MKIYAVKYVLRNGIDNHKYIVAETAQEAMEKAVSVLDNKRVWDREFTSLTYLGEVL